MNEIQFDLKTTSRMMLCQQLEYFGPGTFQQQLDKAYKDFIAFARTNKMDHSQPPFKESKVTWQNSLIVFFDKES